MTTRTYIQAPDGSLELKKIDGRPVEKFESDHLEGGSRTFLPPDYSKSERKNRKWFRKWRRKHAKWFDHREQRLVLTEQAFKKMFVYCKAAPGEISGFAKTEFLQEDKSEGEFGGRKFSQDHPAILITDVRIFEQECTSGGTHLNMNDLTKFYVDLIRSKEKPELWNCWWHTHNDFGVFFSGTDTNTIEKLSASSLLVSICVNKMGDMTARMDENGKLVRNLKPVILPNMDSRLSKLCIEEVKLKVKEAKPYVYTPRGNYKYEKDIDRDSDLDRGGRGGELHGSDDYEDGLHQGYAI